MKPSVTFRRHYVDDTTKKLRSGFANEVVQCLKVLLVSRGGNQLDRLRHVKRAEFVGDKKMEVTVATCLVVVRGLVL